MTILAILVVVLAACALCWAIQQYLPRVSPTVKGILCLTVVVLAVLFVLGATGVLPVGVVNRKI